jgi:hypothetical protein
VAKTRAPRLRPAAASNCKRDADPSGLKADREGDHVANVLGWLRMRQTKTYWHRKTARSEFRAEPQQPGPAYGACPCRNLHHYSHAHRSMEAYFAGAASRSALSGLTVPCSDAAVASRIPDFRRGSKIEVQASLRLLGWPESSIHGPQIRMRTSLSKA